MIGFRCDPTILTSTSYTFVPHAFTLLHLKNICETDLLIYCVYVGAQLSYIRSTTYRSSYIYIYYLVHETRDQLFRDNPWLGDLHDLHTYPVFSSTHISTCMGRSDENRQELVHFTRKFITPVFNRFIYF